MPTLHPTGEHLHSQRVDYGLLIPRGQHLRGSDIIAMAHKAFT